MLSKIYKLPILNWIKSNLQSSWNFQDFGVIFEDFFAIFMTIIRILQDSGANWRIFWDFMSILRIFKDCWAIFEDISGIL